MLAKQGVKKQIPAGRWLKQPPDFPVCMEHMAAAVLFAPNAVISIVQTLWLDCGCELSQAIQTILKGEIKEKKKHRWYSMQDQKSESYR